MSIFMPSYPRRCDGCGDRADIDHLCDDPGPSTVGDQYTRQLDEGVFMAPDGQYLVTPAVIASLVGSDAAERILSHCLDAEGIPRIEAVKAAYARHARALALLRNEVSAAKKAKVNND